MAVAAAATLTLVAAACYNTDTGRVDVGGSINFTLPAFPQTGANAVQVFTEMHYQPSYRAQEGPRFLPPRDSVPITGKEIRYTSLEEYSGLAIPDRTAGAYDPERAKALFVLNCQVCHGPALQGDGVILNFWPRTDTGTLKGPTPADLTADITKSSTDGDLFGFISLGGRQGAAARIRDRRSTSPMPEFGLLLTEDERWMLVQFLRDHIGR
jgi:mono/diheme cytochrome c family protein